MEQKERLWEEPEEEIEPDDYQIPIEPELPPIEINEFMEESIPRAMALATQAEIFDALENLPTSAIPTAAMLEEKTVELIARMNDQNASSQLYNYIINNPNDQKILNDLSRYYSKTGLPAPESIASLLIAEKNYLSQEGVSLNPEGKSMGCVPTSLTMAAAFGDYIPRFSDPNEIVNWWIENNFQTQEFNPQTGTKEEIPYNLGYRINFSEVFKFNETVSLFPEKIITQDFAIIVTDVQYLTDPHFRSNDIISTGGHTVVFVAGPITTTYPIDSSNVITSYVIADPYKDLYLTNNTSFGPVGPGPERLIPVGHLFFVPESLFIENVEDSVIRFYPETPLW
ncbi:hypothetical protein KJ965_00445 [Patescibacteria group bacterium]|nr:hypothetical protein [Patescibacteria group bacterium]